MILLGLGWILGFVFGCCVLLLPSPLLSRHAGGFPARMAVQKNKFVEEWNGQREITEKTFSFEFADVPKFLLGLVLFPYGIYTWTRSEFISKGDRRYKDLV